MQSKSRLILLLLIVMAILNSCAVNDTLFPFKKNGLHGYMTANGKQIITPKYRYALSFNNGFAWVHYEGYWRLIDKNENVLKTAGTTIKAFNRGFSEGLCAIEDTASRKYGYIDKSGVWMITPQFEIAKDFHEGLASVYLNNEWFYIDKNGNRALSNFNGYRNLYEFNDSLACVETKTLKKGFINKRGILVLDTIYDLGTGDFSDGFINSQIGQYYTYIKPSGDTLLKQTFMWSRSFSDGIAIAAYSDSNYHRHTVFINLKGEIIIELPFPFHDILYPGFVEGLAIIQTNSNLFGFIDKTGKIVIEPIYKSASHFKDGFAVVTLDNDKTGIINTKGKLVGTSE